ncbi:zinc finger protein 142 [Solea senegalensis]|uniref:Zinc finger protein 142 n=1 Tax=Solea senegalensis TaxID=28829 RepID=A0AAV6RFY3_SOLSE|nr:zinc finger protein 142 [Solea senegalensis]
MEEHMPLSCVHREFVAETAQKLSDHLSQHNQLPSCAEDSETAPTTASAIGSHQTRVSSRLKRKLKSRPASSSFSPGDGDKEQPEKDGRDTKRRRKAVNRDKDAALDTAVLKSKEYVAEAAEHIYRTHTCPTCRRCFKMRSHLQEHLHIHFPDPSLQCPTCKRYFTSKSKLRIHRLREAGEKVHRCHLCDYSAVEQNAIRRHLISMHADAAQGGVSGPSYPCPTCGQSFRQSRSLKSHMKMHNIPTTSQPVACFQEACSFQTSSPKELLRHTLEVHGVQAVQCRHHACGAVFEKDTDMETHYRTHLAYHCSQCDFSCSNKALFLQHQRQGHAGTDKLCCDFCSFETFNPVEFEQHIGHLHANEKIHRCSQCSYVTSHKRGLKRHVLMHSGERPHKCSLCDFRCRDESYLSRHMLTHSDDKNFMCAECGYVTKWKHYLNVHMRKHAGDLRYQCDQCSYRCHRMDQLNSHKLRHQAKTLMCEICAYACKRKYELRNHMLAKHSGEERPPSVHQCKYCAYTTCYRQALQNHENCKHTKLKEFHCALCAYSSFSSISLFLHKRKSHGYVPGDKAWLEHYAAKEKERNSADFVEDFYNNHSTDHEQPGQSSEGEPASQREQLRPAGAAGHSRQTVPAVQSMETINALNVPQEVVHEGISDSLPSVNSPEEYCTLILTTLSTADCQNPSPQNVEEDQEDNVATSHEECELNDLDDSCEPAIGSILPEAQNRPLESEVRLNAMKKHDKDQADAMVLEGRVQMLVVSSKDARRGLDSHCAKKCPALPRKARTFVGISKICPAAEESCNQGKQALKELPEGTDTDRTELSSQIQSSTDSIDPEIHWQEEEVYDKFKCKLCSFASVRLAIVERHLTTCPNRNQRGENQIPSERLALHLVGEHEDGPPEDKPLKCSTCSFACRHQLVLEHHLRSHGGRRLYKCRDCDYSTRNKQKITWHIRTHTGEKPYRCEQCSYTCTDPSRLKLHMRVHQEERKYLCPECGYKCKWASQLKYHMTKHTGEKPYACDECDYRTNRADALRAHRDTQHCDVRPYVCEKCGKAFKTSFILKTHQRQHSDGRPYVCGLCHKAFRWPAGLRHHFLSHTKQQPFGCRHCSYRAKQKFQVAKHLQRHHPEESVEQGVVRHTEAVSLTLKEALQGTLHERAADVDKEGEASEGAAEETRQ